jgi:hypothetical protein
MANARITIVSILASCFLLTTTLTGCLVAGVLSNGSAFIWPGGLGLVPII